MQVCVLPSTTHCGNDTECSRSSSSLLMPLGWEQGPKDAVGIGVANDLEIHGRVGGVTDVRIWPCLDHPLPMLHGQIKGKEAAEGAEADNAQCPSQNVDGIRQTKGRSRTAALPDSQGHDVCLRNLTALQNSQGEKGKVIKGEGLCEAQTAHPIVARLALCVLGGGKGRSGAADGGVQRQAREGNVEQRTRLYAQRHCRESRSLLRAATSAHQHGRRYGSVLC